MYDCILVTGGAGFIGSNFIHYWLGEHNGRVINVDKQTYAANPASLGEVLHDPRHVLIKADIIDIDLLQRLLAEYKPKAIIHLAAETHVDRSILGPAEFVQTNITGTHNLLRAANDYWSKADHEIKKVFRFLHVSTDEVYGSLDESDLPFTETARYAPSSPYAASKAAADHLVRSYYRTYGLPVLITNCSNNFGPCQYPEKLIPLVLTRAISGESIPIYGDGKNVRDWLYVKDHCKALTMVLESGRPSTTYNISARNERDNLSLVGTICDLLDELAPQPKSVSYRDQIRFVPDRPGHDRRYALDPSRIESEIGWHVETDFIEALRNTVLWYLDNTEWINSMLDNDYDSWIKANYSQRDSL